MGRAEIALLPPEVARKIAAGEVIDRPASVVRELMENSVDAGATNVAVAIERGGLDLIQVRDDGHGLSREELLLAALPHATSKLRQESDLLSISSLGFRGEALSSMAAVGELDILSSCQGDGLAHRLRCRPGEREDPSPDHGPRGTTVSLRALFGLYPARKAFLKRSASEASQCLQVFIDRALPRPDIGFSLSMDGSPRLLLPASSPKARVLGAYQPNEPESFYFEYRGPIALGSLSAVMGQAEIRAHDRRFIQIFLNGRRIVDFSLQKAVEIAYQGLMPGGVYPKAFVFLDIDPEFVDFNIHPAKKEVRFKDPRRLQTELIEALRLALGPLRQGERVPKPSPGGDYPSATSLFTDAPYQVSPLGADARPHELSYLAELGSSRQALSLNLTSPPLLPQTHDGGEVHEPAPNPATQGATTRRVLGQALGVFIVVELPEHGILFLDQHAAHERILFDALRDQGPRSQALLIPYEFETESQADDDFLSSAQQALADSGYAFTRLGPCRWHLEAWPAGLRDKASLVVQSILGTRGMQRDLDYELAAITACRSAIKEGETLSQVAMEALVDSALSLAEARCPHGRPIWFVMGREEMYRRVARLV